jgi:hypothetical protein
VPTEEKVLIKPIVFDEPVNVKPPAAAQSDAKRLKTELLKQKMAKLQQQNKQQPQQPSSSPAPDATQTRRIIRPVVGGAENVRSILSSERGRGRGRGRGKQASE